MDAWIPFVLLPFIAWGVRHKLIRDDGWTALKKVTLGIGMSAFDDWVVADTIGNSFGTVTAIFMILTMAGRGTSWDWRLVGIVIAGLIGYETTNLTGHHGFDVNDVLATVVFGTISAMIYARVLARRG